LFFKVPESLEIAAVVEKDQDLIGVGLGFGLLKPLRSCLLVLERT
jgi:hypothetical protein